MSSRTRKEGQNSYTKATFIPRRQWTRQRLAKICKGVIATDSQIQKVVRRTPHSHDVDYIIVPATKARYWTQGCSTYYSIYFRAVVTMNSYNMCASISFIEYILYEKLNIWCTFFQINLMNCWTYTFIYVGGLITIISWVFLILGGYYPETRQNLKHLKDDIFRKSFGPGMLKLSRTSN